MSAFAAASQSGMAQTTLIHVQSFDNADAALAHATTIYNSGIAHLRDSLQRFVAGENFSHHVRACYPYLRVHTATVARADSRLAYGFVAGPGTYETTLTRPDLFQHYYREQFNLLLKNHGITLEVGLSAQPIPVHFSLAEHDHLEGSLSADRRLLLRDVFDLPDLSAMDDGIANGTHEPTVGQDRHVRHPLSLFTAPRVDYSLHRLRHYTGTAPENFQNFVLFTNYQFYIDEFIKLGHELMADEKSGYAAFVEPGNVVKRRSGMPPESGDELGSAPPRLPQMPAYHLVREDRAGITMVNIGVGPANAKTITDHLAVLDAVARFEFSRKFNIWAGRFLEPSDRANLYGPFYAHNWSVYQDGVQNGQPSVYQGRDNGVAYWGDFGKKVKMKVSVGAFDGKSADGNPDVIGAARVQLDFWDAEDGYYLNGTYYGDKNLLAVGGSTQVQSGNTATTVDFLLERKLANAGAFSVEAEYASYNGLGGYVPGTAKSQGAYILGSYIFPKPVGMGKFEILGKFAKAESMGQKTSISQKTTEVNLNYLIKQFNARVMTYYQDKRFNIKAQPNTWQIGIGLQIQM